MRALRQGDRVRFTDDYGDGDITPGTVISWWGSMVVVVFDDEPGESLSIYVHNLQLLEPNGLDIMLDKI